MITILPEWYKKAENEIRRSIILQADELNINYTFIYDSKLIDESIYNIMNVLVRLKQEVKGKFNEEEIKQFKKFGEGKTKKEKVDESETKTKTKTKTKRNKHNSSITKRDRSPNKKI